MKHSVLLAILFFCISLTCYIQPSMAQPTRPNFAATGDEESDTSNWEKLQKQNARWLKTYPTLIGKQYATLLRASAKSSPAIHPLTAIRAWGNTIDIVNRGGKNEKQALALCDEALELYNVNPESATLIASKARVFLNSNYPEEAQAFIDANWDTVIHSPVSSARNILWFECLALQAQNKSREIPNVLERAILQNPAFLDEDQQSTNAWMYRRIVDGLLQRGDRSEALSWAKLRWMECPFRSSNVVGAAELLRKVLLTGDQTNQETQATSFSKFISAQGLSKFTDGESISTLLSNAPVPVISNLNDLLAEHVRSEDPLDGAQTHGQINLLIVAGDWKNATIVAQNEYLNPSTVQWGIQEIARILKAHDFSLVRSNQFLDWVSDHRKMDPLQPFLKEVEVDAQIQAVYPQVNNLRNPKVVLPENLNEWQQDDLRLKDLIFDLSQPKVLNASPVTDMLRYDFLSLMADFKNEDVLLAPVLKDHSKATERWVGYGLAAAGDDRAVPILEDVLADTPKPVDSRTRAADLTYLLLCLSKYYEDKGDLMNAAKTQLRHLEYLTGSNANDAPDAKVPISGLIGNSLVAAARFYQEAGEPEKAKTLYEKIPQYGYGWSSGVALYDQAMFLIDKNKNVEARALLQTPIDGKYADQAKVGIEVALSTSYYRTGELEMAREHSQQAIDTYASIVSPLPGEGLDLLAKLAEERLQWIKKWEAASLLPERNTLNFQGSPPDIKAQTLAIYSLQQTTISAKCDDPRIQVFSLGIGRQEPQAYAKRFEVSVVDAGKPSEFETTIRFESANFSLSVPVHVEINR